ncbi:hypothetical protein O7R01_11975 [Vibrio owensii]|nr:hypothetical protein [Vibrio owensii]
MRHEFNGVKGLKNISKHYGVSLHVLRYRLYELKIPFPDVMSVSRSRYVYNEAVGITAISKLVGVPYSTLRRRLMKGATLEEAILRSRYSRINNG